MTGRSSDRHVLLVEPRTEGHHLTWLRYIAEDLLSAGFRVSAATCPEPSANAAIAEQLGEMNGQLKQFSLATKTLRSASGLRTVVEIAAQAAADEIFFNSFDEIASQSLRKAVFGILPPSSMRRKTGGIYFRPRFLQKGFALSGWLKRLGFRRLARQNFFNRLLLLDENLAAAARTDFPTVPLTFLPDPYPAEFRIDRSIARAELRLEPSRQIFLFYGGPYRRKGMHLAAEAFVRLALDSHALLLYAGQPPEDANLLAQLRGLEQRGVARLLLHRVSDSQEKLLFASADFVLLPYLGHFGSSGVLSRAVGAHKPVIASDEQLVGQRVRQHDLGLLFPTGNSEALKNAIIEAATIGAEVLTRWQANAAKYSSSCSREAFRAALLASFQS